MKPTELQIEQAERLQKAGLCLGHPTRKYISKKANGEYTFKCKEENSIAVHRIVGPLPTFEEAIQEASKLLRCDPSNSSYEQIVVDGDKISIYNFLYGSAIGRPLFESKEINAEAAIEALLYLEAKQ